VSRAAQPRRFDFVFSHSERWMDFHALDGRLTRSAEASFAGPQKQLDQPWKIVVFGFLEFSTVWPGEYKWLAGAFWTRFEQSRCAVASLVAYTRWEIQATMIVAATAVVVEAMMIVEDTTTGAAVTKRRWTMNTNRHDCLFGLKTRIDLFVMEYRN